MAIGSGPHPNSRPGGGRANSRRARNFRIFRRYWILPSFVGFIRRARVRRRVSIPPVAPPRCDLVLRPTVGRIAYRPRCAGQRPPVRPRVRRCRTGSQSVPRFAASISPRSIPSRFACFVRRFSAETCPFIAFSTVAAGSAAALPSMLRGSSDTAMASFRKTKSPSHIASAQ